MDMVSLSNKKRAAFPEESKTLKVYFLEMNMSRPLTKCACPLPCPPLELDLICSCGGFGWSQL